MQKNFTRAFYGSLRMRASVLALATAGAVMGVAGVAAAADAPASSDSATQVPEVVVTAQRRVENLQVVPISAQVVKGTTLAEENLTNLTSLAQTLPEVHIEATGRSNEIYIRGIGSGQNQAFDQSVGVFVDDIYHGRSRFTTSTFLDLDHIEVLKGPQSTFFGNNSIAGAVNVVTEKPGNTFDGWMRALASPNSGTNGGQYAIEGATNIPVSDQFAVRVAGTFNGEEGWLDDINTGRKVPWLQNLGGRASFLWRPSDDFDADLKVEATRNLNIGTRPEQVISCPPPAPFVAAGFCASLLAQGLPHGLGANERAYSKGQEVNLDTQEAVLTMHKKVGDDTLTSVTGWYHYNFNLNLDTDGLPQDMLNAHVPETYRQFSQELRLQSPTGGQFEYLAGAYYQHDRLDFTQDLSYFFVTPKVAAAPSLAALLPYTPLGTETVFSQNEDVYSIFGSATWNVNDKAHIDIGVRGSETKKSFNWSLGFGTATTSFGNLTPIPANLVLLADKLGLGTAGSLSGDRTDSAFMPSAKIRLDITPNAMAYVSWAKGFKAGGFNGTDSSDNINNLPFAPESVSAWEVGLKSEWFNRRVLLNLAAFYSTYNDLQVSVSTIQSSGALVSVVQNAANALSEGVEFQGQWIVTDNFRLSLNGAYLDAHYIDYQNVSPTALQALHGLKVQDMSGRPTEWAPRWSGDLVATYTHELPGELRLTAEGQAFYSGSYYLTGTDDDTFARQGAYTRIDARLTVESPGRRWAFDVIGKNLTNRNIETFAAPMPTSNGSGSAVKEQPLNVAFQVRYRW